MIGSRKHVLDLVENQKRFQEKINRILRPSDFKLAKPLIHQPTGRANQLEMKEVELETFLTNHSVDGLPGLDEAWWIRNRQHGGSRPTWDLLAHLQAISSDQSGLLLVEAKGHITEAKRSDKKTRPNPDSQESMGNDTRIRNRLKQTQSVWNREGLVVGKFKLSTESHYQISNRIAYATKLASLGYPVVLLYLGFLNDPDFDDPIVDEMHWHRVVGGYLQGVVPQSFPERRHDKFKNGGSVHMIIRALEIDGAD